MLLVTRGLKGPKGRLLTRGLGLSPIIPPSDDPTSLLEAIKQYWDAHNLASSIAPLYVEGAHPNSVLPFVVIDGLREVLPGETPDDTPVELFATVHHTTSVLARNAGRLIENHFGDTSIVPKAIEREQLAWTVGSEKFCEREESRADLTPRPYLNKRVFRYFMHFQFTISGRW